MKLKFNIDLILVAAAILFYIVGDLASTIAAYLYLGTAEYETSTLMRLALDTGDIPGFIATKLVMGLTPITITYLLITRVDGVQPVGRGILIGTALAGLYVTASNFNIPINGCSLWLAGVDPGTITTLLIAGCALVGFLYGLFDAPMQRPKAKIVIIK